MEILIAYQIYHCGGQGHETMASMDAVGQCEWPVAVGATMTGEWLMLDLNYPFEESIRFKLLLSPDDPPSSLYYFPFLSSLSSVTGMPLQLCYTTSKPQFFFIILYQNHHH